MARCVTCGEKADDPVWAVYADPAFKRKQQHPFPLHPACFSGSETITAVEWNSGATELIEHPNSPRFRRVDPPEEA
jgi:hypothetical protein